MTTALTGHVILITGAAGGLGSTAALALAKQGATLILLDKKIPAMETLYDRISALGAPEPFLAPFDLSGANEQQYQELVDTLKNKFGSLQGLLHSAVDSGIGEPIAQLKTLTWAQTINLNLNAAFLLTRMLLPLMQNSPSQASIVFTGDSNARLGKAYAGAYGIAKIALEGLARILADELEAAGKVRVNTLLPGPVDSPQRKRAYPAENKNVLPEMESLNPVYEYLFTEKSTNVTGQVIKAADFIGASPTS